MYILFLSGKCLQANKACYQFQHVDVLSGLVFRPVASGSDVFKFSSPALFEASVVIVMSAFPCEMELQESSTSLIHHSRSFLAGKDSSIRASKFPLCSLRVSFFIFLKVSVIEWSMLHSREAGDNFSYDSSDLSDSKFLFFQKRGAIFFKG